MAAVLCLILLPLMAAVGFMVGSAAGSSFTAFIGVFAFLLLGAGMFVGAFNMSRGWENEQES